MAIEGYVVSEKKPPEVQKNASETGCKVAAAAQNAYRKRQGIRYYPRFSGHSVPRTLFAVESNT
jgi:hypothetical protein